jgi:hypothetical protein
MRRCAYFRIPIYSFLNSNLICRKLLRMQANE